MNMKTVGIRELKDRLSEYLRQVRAGESVLVTDRGEVIAEVSPPGQVRADPSVPPGLVQLARRGLLTLGSTSGAVLYKPLVLRRRRKISAAELLAEERGNQ
jgi:antitoxin (DNA-binding transcriptional repressor) of toxin-antitoxin stability system